MSIVIVTGGSRGLGASIAVQCAKRGMGVILTFNSSKDATGKVAGRIEVAGGYIL
jgi:NAD(P)-dependent dehydrogenase (short-subunit alcohol dehydrogenase family)